MPSELWETWQRTVAAAPAKALVFDADRVLTAEALAAEASAIAATAPRGSIEGQTVGFAEPNGARWLAVFLALQKLSAVALPLDPTLPAAQAADAAASLGAAWLLGADGWAPLTQPACPPADGACLIKTTSGSTGRPQALRFTAAQMLADGSQIAATMEIGPGDRNLGAIPFGHSYGLGNLVLPLIAQGTGLICSTEILPDALAAQIARLEATVFPSVPAILRALAESAVDPERLRTLRRIISAGAPLRRAVAWQFLAKFGRPVRNFYGSSETGGICFDRTGEATAAGRGVGQPLAGVHVSLDEEGRVTVRSPAVVAPGLFTLPDLGAWNERGELILTGRATPLANIGGKKVAPAQIEQALRALEGVSDAWVGVRTRSGAAGEDFLLAAVETERPRAEILRALSGCLPAWQIPRRLWAEPRLPRNSRGKLDREELETRCLDDAPGGAGA